MFLLQLFNNYLQSSLLILGWSQLEENVKKNIIQKSKQKVDVKMSILGHEGHFRKGRIMEFSSKGDFSWEDGDTPSTKRYKSSLNLYEASQWEVHTQRQTYSMLLIYFQHLGCCSNRKRKGGVHSPCQRKHTMLAMQKGIFKHF